MAAIEEIMDQEEAVLGEVWELESAINELTGYLNSLKSLVKGLYPKHYDGGDRLDVGSMKSELSDIEMTLDDFVDDVQSVHNDIHRLEGALDELEGMEEEE